MTIHLNGSSNPLAVNYNSNALDTVYATVNGVDSVFPVWERQSAFPESIGSVVTVTLANGKKAYFRNMTKDYQWISIEGSETYHVCRYLGDVTIEIPFASGKQIGASPTAYDPIRWLATNTRISSVSGLPSGYSFYSAGSSDNGSTLAFDVYQVSDGILRPEKLVAMNLQSYSAIERSGLCYITTYFPGNNWVVFTRSGGWIYQGAGRLVISHD